MPIASEEVFQKVEYYRCASGPSWGPASKEGRIVAALFFYSNVARLQEFTVSTLRLLWQFQQSFLQLSPLC